MSLQVTNPSMLLRVLHKDLQEHLEPEGGQVFMARDPLNALEILAASPAAFFVVVLDKGVGRENVVSPLYMLRARVGIYVAQNRGLEVQASGNLLQLTERCESVRDRLLTLPLPGAADEVPTYDGRELVTLPDGMPLAAYEMNFSARLTGPQLEPRSM